MKDCFHITAYKILNFCNKRPKTITEIYYKFKIIYPRLKQLIKQYTGLQWLQITTLQKDPKPKKLQKINILEHSFKTTPFGYDMMLLLHTMMYLQYKRHLRKFPELITKVFNILKNEELEIFYGSEYPEKSL